MILRPDSGSLLFITQPDHARLAADVIVRWRDDDLDAHPRREDIVLAVREHDNGWIEEDAETHLDPSGAPLDFVTVPIAVKHRIWPRGIGRLAEHNGYAAVLVAQHALTVYAQHRADPGWSAFFADVESHKARLLQAGDGTCAAAVDADYPFLRSGDLLSLLFCTGSTEPVSYNGRRFILNRDRVSVSPDPFGGSIVPLRVRARRLPARRWASTAELRAALDEAPLELLRGTAAGEP